MSKTYAIADLHGRYDLLWDALKSIELHAGDEPHHIVTMGDYIDRGPDSSGVVQCLINLQAEGKNVICLKGNHEDMMVDTLTKPLHPDWWIGNGGGATLISYGHPRSGEYQPEFVPQEHIDWINGLPLMHIDKHRVFVHAWVDSSVPLDRQKPEKLMWELYPSGARYGHRLTGRHVVHGHHQFEDGPKCYKGRTDLDTFAWYTGRLVVGVFDDDVAGGPMDFIEVIGPPDTQVAEAA